MPFVDQSELGEAQTPGCPGVLEVGGNAGPRCGLPSACCQGVQEGVGHEGSFLSFQHGAEVCCSQGITFSIGVGWQLALAILLVARGFERCRLVAQTLVQVV